ncbi:DUF397 domain-containing protein [Streptomyces sp.]
MTSPRRLGEARRSGDGGGGNCVEIAACPQALHIRDSKNPDGPNLTVSGEAWAAFVSSTA